MADVPNNAAKVDAINEILDSGVVAARAGDLSTNVDVDALRKRRDELIAADPTLRPTRKPRVYGIDLGNAW